MTRTEIHSKISDNLNRIKELEKENKKLEREAILLSDDVQQFKEQIESHPKRKWQRKPNWLDGKLVGRIFWKEHFVDEDTGEPIVIERQQVVRVDGEWCYW